MKVNMKMQWTLFIMLLMPATAALTAAKPEKPSIKDEKQWQTVYDVRKAYFEKHLGRLPQDILKVGNLTGVWPGGGLFMLPAAKIDKKLWVYTTFGLTNPDMPTGVTIDNIEVKTDKQGRVTKNVVSLKKKKKAVKLKGTAGYGYEILMVARKKQQWPLWFMQWSVNAEIVHDVDLLTKVSMYNGLTVEKIKTGPSDYINVLITKARKPLPGGIELPNGRMEILVATVITEQEMQWSMKNGRDKLLEKLMESGVGQISDRGRKSVVK